MKESLYTVVIFFYLIFLFVVSNLFRMPAMIGAFLRRPKQDRHAGLQAW